MDRNIILSIHPIYASMIMKGEKTVEFRKNPPAGIYSIRKIYLYSTSPVKKIIGSVLVERIYTSDDKNYIWYRAQKNKPGINHDEYEEYFEGREFAHVIVFKADSFQRLDLELPCGAKAPRNFIYTDMEV